ncbi:MAG: hypothetical protein ACREHE_16465 [Rhizomicrobium sp.]
MTRALATAVLCLLSHAALAGAGIDDIPSAIPSSVNEPTSSATANFYLQSDLTLNAPRAGLSVPLPSPPSAWEARLFLDSRIAWRIDDALSFSYSGRLNLRAEDGLSFPGHQNIRNDLREAYFTWDNGSGLFLELGRINLRDGVAEGFNPIDYFKTRTVVEAISADPTVLREDRLGTAMLLGEMVWTGGAFALAIAPKLASDSPPYLDAELPSFNPMLDRTNAHTRLLAKASFHLAEDISPELLAYSEAGHSRFGLNMTKGFGQAVVAYLEWSGGRRASLADDAVMDGIRNHVLFSPPLPVDGSRHFRNDLALGLTYATKLGINIDLEYDYHQAGFAPVDWRNWFAGGVDPNLHGALWFIRGYANDQQEPMARNSLFVRIDWQNAFVRNLALTGFVDTDLHDGSGLAQVTADYYLSPSWSAGGLVDLYFGKPRSNFGSLPLRSSVLFKLSRYF